MLNPVKSNPGSVSSSALSHADRPKLRGRPRKEHITVIDDDIIKVATEMFGEVGYRATAMDAIATKVGIAKRTLYARYPDKVSLYKAVVTTIIHNVQTPEPPSFPDVRSCILFHTENYFIIASDPAMRVLGSLGDTEIQSLPELKELSTQLTHDVGIAPIGKTIALAAEAEGLKVSDPEFIASSLLDLAAGHYERVKVMNLRSDFAAFKFAADRITNLLMAGVRAENAAG